MDRHKFSKRFFLQGLCGVNVLGGEGEFGVGGGQCEGGARVGGREREGGREGHWFLRILLGAARSAFCKFGLPSEGRGSASELIFFNFFIRRSAERIR